jgi:ribosomal protein L37AE/L43A
MAIKYTCPKCKGDRVGYDANSIWDVALQQWTLGNTYDSAWCNDCGELKDLVEVELPDGAAQKTV